MKKQTLLEILEALEAVYPRNEKPALLVKIWFTVLEDIPDDVIMRGLNKCLKEHATGFLPTPAEFRKYCIGKTQNEEEQKAITAWSQMINAVRQYGTWSAIDFEDTAIAETIRMMGGWNRICASEDKEINWLRKEFIELYIAAVSKKKSYTSIVGVGDVKLIESHKNLVKYG